MIIHKFLNYLFPRFCPVCSRTVKTGENICPECLNKIVLIKKPFCSCCGQPFPLKYTPGQESDYLCGGCRQSPPFFQRARALGYYQGVLKELIHHYKYRKKRTLVKELIRLWKENGISDLFPPLLNLSRREEREKKLFDWIIPVPLHWKKVQERGFDQSFLLAAGIAERLKIPLSYNNLTRIRPTAPQVSLTKKERKTNIRNAFRLKKGKEIKNKRILLIDDVFTTGATIRECCKVLKSSGAKDISVLTLARTV